MTIKNNNTSVGVMSYVSYVFSLCSFIVDFKMGTKVQKTGQTAKDIKKAPLEAMLIYYKD